MKKNVLICLMMLVPISLFGIDVSRKFSAGFGGGLYKIAMEYDYMTIGRSYSGEIKYGITKEMEFGVLYAVQSSYAAENLAGFLFPNRSVDTDGNVIKVYPTYDRIGTGRPYLPDKNQRIGLSTTRSEIFDYNLKSQSITPFIQFRSMIQSVLNPFITIGANYFSYEMLDQEGNQIEVDSSYYIDGADTTWVPLKNSHWGVFTKIGAEFFPVEPFGIQVGVVAHFPLADLFTKQYLDSLYALIGPEIKFSFYYGGQRDSDKDGVSDKFDKCPDTQLSAVVDEFGCPMDSDADGIYDGLDECPNTPYGAIVDLRGCPLDTDNDGIPDGIDKCPDSPKATRVDSIGCPVDNDADGVPDYLDLCPNTPIGSIVDSDGCPLDGDGDGVYDGIDECPNTQYGALVDEKGCAKDSDDDGVADGIDKCPNTPPGIEVDSTGCPLVKELKTGESITIRAYFDPCEWTVNEIVAEQLEPALQMMKTYPDMKVSIEGHTDDVVPIGECERKIKNNTELSIRRAKAVAEWLVSKGISQNRLETVGYGENRPVDTNMTPEGRANNRRIEIRRIN